MKYYSEFWVDYLSVKCHEIENDSSKDMILKTTEAYERILRFADLGKKEGLLALEEASEELDWKEEPQALFSTMIRLVVDGTEPKIVETIGMNKCISMNLPSYQGLMNQMYIQGSLMIQAGEKPWIIEEVLLSMLPKPIIDELIRRDGEKASTKASGEIDEGRNRVEELCTDDREIDEKDHSLINETAKTLLMLSDMDVQLLLKETKISSLTVAMKGLPGKARARILNNMSPRLATMVAEDMAYMGPVRLKDVEEECVKVMKILLKLADSCFIQEYDLSILKVVLDMYECAEKENSVLKDKYKELKRIIDRIYND